MKSFFTLLGVLFISLLLGCSSDQSSINAPHVKVTLATNLSSIDNKSDLYVGMYFELEEGWHVYWRNPGDSGLAPHINFSSTNSSIKFGELLWPAPEPIKVGRLINYGYEGMTLLFAPVIIEGDKNSGSSIPITAQADWLVCKDECIPGTAKLSTHVDRGENQASNFANVFSIELKKVPAPLDNVSYAIEEQNDRVNLTLLPLKDRLLPSEALFIPQDRGIIDYSGAQISDRGNNSLTISLPRSKVATGPISRLRGVLIADEGWDASHSTKTVAIDTSPGSDKFEYAAPITTESPKVVPMAEQEQSFGYLLLLALLGGLILNAMPCVFPVLAIKALGFIEQAKRERASVTLHALYFSLGVILSFVLLAALAISLRSVGKSLGWGFQLQYPGFVVGMALVFFTLAILYLTERPLFTSIQRAAGKGLHYQGYIGSFAHGVLATAVATPCTAPFMGTAVAAAFTLPTIGALLIFATMGVGMCLPYIAIALSPGLLRFLPKPGCWMVTFKQSMAFPLLASTIWLLWVFARQVGISEVALIPLTRALVGLLITSFGFWLVTRGSEHYRFFVKVIGAIIFLYGAWYALPKDFELERAKAAFASNAKGKEEPFVDSYGLKWESFSEDRLNLALKEGRYVFLDFTAAWCVTCQVNKEIILGSSSVRDEFKKLDVVLLKADWTSSDPMITRALERFGRQGVPLNLIYRPNETAPTILPSILTPGAVLEALNGSSNNSLK